MRENLTVEQLADRLHDWALNRENLLAVLPHAIPRMEILSDFAPLAAFLASGQLAIEKEKYLKLN